jgi:hypothetical protein
MQNARRPQIRNVNISRGNGECESCLVIENERRCNAECKASNHAILLRSYMPFYCDILSVLFPLYWYL